MVGHHRPVQPRRRQVGTFRVLAFPTLLQSTVSRLARSDTLSFQRNGRRLPAIAKSTQRQLSLAKLCLCERLSQVLPAGAATWWKCSAGCNCACMAQQQPRQRAWRFDFSPDGHVHQPPPRPFYPTPHLYQAGHRHPTGYVMLVESFGRIRQH